MDTLPPEPVDGVRSFRFCPGCGKPTSGAGAGAVQQGATKMFECATCGYILYFNPGSAVAAILAVPDGRVLFLRRQRDPGKGMLGLPGGFIDPGESAAQALTREVSEETGLAIDLDQWRYLATFPNTYSYRRVIYDVTDVFYVCPIPDFEGILLDTAESAAWIPIAPSDALADETFAFASNRRAVEAYIALKGLPT